MSYSQSNPANMFEDMQRMPTQYLQQAVSRKDASSPIAMAVLGERNKVAAAAQAQQAQQAAQATTSVADQTLGRAQQLATQQQQRAQQGIAAIPQRSPMPGGGGIGQLPGQRMARGGIVSFAGGDAVPSAKLEELARILGYRDAAEMKKALAQQKAAAQEGSADEAPTTPPMPESSLPMSGMFGRVGIAHTKAERDNLARMDHGSTGPATKYFRPKGMPPTQAPAAPQDNAPVGRFDPKNKDSMMLGILGIKDPADRAKALAAWESQLSKTGSASMAPAGFGPPEQWPQQEAPRGGPSAPAPTLPAAPPPQMAEAQAAPAAPAQPSASEKILQELLGRQAPVAPTPQEALRQAQEMNALGGVPEAMKRQQDMVDKYGADEQARLAKRGGRREGLMALLNGMQGRSPLRNASAAYSAWGAANNADAKNVGDLKFQMEQKVAAAQLLYKQGNVEEAKSILKGVIAQQNALRDKQITAATAIHGDELRARTSAGGEDAATKRTKMQTDSSARNTDANIAANKERDATKTADDTKAQKVMLAAAMGQAKILLEQRKAMERTGGDTTEIDKKLAALDATIREAGGIPEADPNASGTVLRYDNKGNRIN